MKKPHLLRNPFLLFLMLLCGPVFAQPANNVCGSATNITVAANCGAPVAGTLFQATATGSPSSGYGPTYDVWYRFTATSTSVQITIPAVGGGPTNTNTYIEAFNSANCAGISTLTSIGVANRGSGLTITDMAVGTQYYFRVFTNVNPTSGAWTFSVCVATTLTAPGNDNCAGATALTIGTSNTGGRTAGATATGGIPVGCATGTPDDDVWYRFTATSNTHMITVNPNPSSGASTTVLASSGACIQLFSGACGTLTSIGCTERGSLRATGLTTGTQYYIRVYSFGAAGTNPCAAPTNSGLTFSILVSAQSNANTASGRMNEIYRQTTLSPPSMLNDPWEVTYGPDGYLWVTESKGYRILRIDPNTGERSTVLDIGYNSWFLSGADRAFNMRYELNYTSPQGGMAGMAIHPDFMHPTTPKKFVYVAYTQQYAGGSAPTGTFYVNTVARFTYNTTTNKLESPVFLCDTLPGSNDHNSQRMIIAPVGGTDYLFYAAGDMGAGQFSNTQRPNRAQLINFYEGKILRFNLEPDADPGTYDRWIPDNNPYNDDLPVESAVWAIGIRNNQGFAYDYVNDVMYGSSHGPFSDDEINIIEGDHNYGHPVVIGYSWDGNANNTTAGAAPNMSPAHPSSCPMITNEAATAAGLTNYRDPLFSAYPNSTAFPSLENLWTSTSGANGQWPSEGWSGLDLYTHTLIPGWKQSLVAASLKWGRLVKIRLTPNGTSIAPMGGTDTISYFGSTNRFRDLALHPNGKDMYVIMDRSATTSGPSAGNPIIPACGGCLQRYTFLGYNDVGGKSSISPLIDVTAGAPNACATGTTITIDATNNNLWVPITGPDGNIMAEIFANGNNLGTVTSSFYKNTGAIRVRNNNRYLDRNITITPQTQPSTPVRIRLYLSKAEYDALDANPLSGVSAITDLRILKNNDACGAAVASNTTLVAPTFAEAHGANGYMLQATINSFSSFYFGTANLTLPLQLLSFKGQLQNNATLLQWETTNEINTSHFVVERSIDNVSFSDIGNVTAAGNTTTTKQYSLTDNDVMNLPSTVVYYRLRMVDIDGSHTYSNTIRISLGDITGKVSVFPNPANQEVKLSVVAEAEGKALWKIIDNSGRVVMQSTINLKRGNNSTMIDTRKLAAGMYYINISGNGIDQNIKLQKL